MKIKPGQCKCGATVHLVEEAGMKWVGDVTPLDAQEAVAALVAGRELYRIRYVGSTPTNLSTAKPDVLKALASAPVGDRPEVVQSHGCPTNAVRALLPASQRGGGPGAPKAHRSPSVAPSRPSSGASRSSETVPTADPRPSSAQPHRGASSADPSCDRCGRVCRPGTYWGFEYAGQVTYAEHADCPA